MRLVSLILFTTFAFALRGTAGVQMTMHKGFLGIQKHSRGVKPTHRAFFAMCPVHEPQERSASLSDTQATADMVTNQKKKTLVGVLAMCTPTWVSVLVVPLLRALFFAVVPPMSLGFGFAKQVVPSDGIRLEKIASTGLGNIEAGLKNVGNIEAGLGVLGGGLAGGLALNACTGNLDEDLKRFRSVLLGAAALLALKTGWTWIHRGVVGEFAGSDVKGKSP